MTLQLATRPLLTTEQAAQILGVSKSYLDNDRSQGARIPYVKIGRFVRYKPDDLEAVIHAKTKPALR